MKLNIENNELDRLEIALKACQDKSQKWIDFDENNNKYYINELGSAQIPKNRQMEKGKQLEKQKTKEIIDECRGHITTPRWIELDIKRRQGQDKFRFNLCFAYGLRCIVTGCDTYQAIEAAHIKPYADRDMHNTKESMLKSNGLLLRADIHTLFDLELIGIDPLEDKIHISKKIMKSEYAYLDGELLKYKPKHANQDSLKARWESFLKGEK